MKKRYFEETFALRATVSFFLILLLMLISILRVAAINYENYTENKGISNSKKIEIGYLRGSILDSNGVPLTNSKMQTVAAIMPTKSAIAYVNTNLSGDEKKRVMALLLEGKPAVCVLNEKAECDGISCIGVPVRITENTVAHHIIGYTDGEGNGVYGIEKAYNKLLKGDKMLACSFAVDGKGRPLLGIAPEFNGKTEALSNAVYLTIDINIQKAVEKAAEGLESGAVIVSDCKTGKIKAMASLPDFSPDDISASLNKENSPLMNKCLMSYNAGSVFKPCIAAAALENKMGEYTFLCEGKSVIESRTFNCHKISGHGPMNLSSALSNSCNCFFYNLAIELGSKQIYCFAEYLSFGSKIKIADNIYTDSGFLPTAKELNSKSDIANFGIGQGSIMVSPVAMLNLYNAVANGGIYYQPSIIEKTGENGKITEYDKGFPTRVMSDKTAENIKKSLKGVLIDGTGKAAFSEKVTAAGKTATAQTGRRDDSGKEITNSWFCGFFPYESPEYSVVVMSDKEYKKSPAEVFKSISEALAEK